MTCSMRYFFGLPELQLKIKHFLLHSIYNGYTAVGQEQPFGLDNHCLLQLSKFDCADSISRRNKSLHLAYSSILTFFFPLSCCLAASDSLFPFFCGQKRLRLWLLVNGRPRNCATWAANLFWMGNECCEYFEDLLRPRNEHLRDYSHFHSWRGHCLTFVADQTSSWVVSLALQFATAKSAESVKDIHVNSSFIFPPKKKKIFF